LKKINVPQRRKKVSPKKLSHRPRLRKQPTPPASRRAGKLFEDLVALQARLLAPGGCPLDREQTHESLRTYLVEETYEVLDAMESQVPQKFAEELGDLLLQIVFHSQLAKQAGHFEIADVIEHIHTKMVRRHPHVFGDAKASTAGEVLKNWEQIKAEERRKEQSARSANPSGNGSAKEPEEGGLLGGVPRSLPAVLEAYQFTRRASRVGFDWKDIRDVLRKLREEIAELEAELAATAASSQNIEGEVGDLLFTVVNVARFLKLDPEVALKKSNRKFFERFRAMEREAAAAGHKLADLDSSQLDAMWNRAKAAEAVARVATKRQPTGVVIAR
jgi:MazG family protein